MSLKITKKSILETAGEVRRNKYAMSGIYSMEMAMIAVAGKYFWLPVFDMFNEAGLVFNDLAPGKFLIESGFVFQGATLPDSHYQNPSLRTEYFMTLQGLDFLYNLIRRVMDDNIALTPPVTIY